MIRWMSIPSREATQPPGRCKPKTRASSSRKELAPFRANSSLQSSTPLEMFTLLWKTTGSHTSTFLLPEEAQPSPSLRPLQPRTKSNMSPKPRPYWSWTHSPSQIMQELRQLMVGVLLICLPSPSEQAMFGQRWPNVQKRDWRLANVG